MYVSILQYVTTQVFPVVVMVVDVVVTSFGLTPGSKSCVPTSPTTGLQVYTTTNTSFLSYHRSHSLGQYHDLMELFRIGE
jgi:hypothetical protein